jgi:type 1 glutamine amidotransferase
VASTGGEYGWPWYGGLVGAWFADHPPLQPGTVRVENPAEPSTAHLPAAWTRSDEWYNLRRNPRPDVTVLLTADESSYTGGTMGDHPITWRHEYGGGRSWYTALGHASDAYADPAFTQLLLGGVRYAAGVP